MEGETFEQGRAPLEHTLLRPSGTDFPAAVVRGDACGRAPRPRGTERETRGVWVELTGTSRSCQSCQSTQKAGPSGQRKKREFETGIRDEMSSSDGGAEMNCVTSGAIFRQTRPRRARWCPSSHCVIISEMFQGRSLNGLEPRSRSPCHSVRPRSSRFGSSIRTTKEPHSARSRRSKINDGTEIWGQCSG